MLMRFSLCSLIRARPPRLLRFFKHCRLLSPRWVTNEISSCGHCYTPYLL